MPISGGRGFPAEPDQRTTQETQEYGTSSPDAAMHRGRYGTRAVHVLATERCVAEPLRVGPGRAAGILAAAEGWSADGTPVAIKKTQAMLADRNRLRLA